MKHINGIKTDNRLENLECREYNTASINLNRGIRKYETIRYMGETLDDVQ